MPDDFLYRLPPYTVNEVLFPHEVTEIIDYGLAQNNVPSLWARTKGKGVRVGIVDTGCELDHEDLAGAIVGSRDFTRSPYAAYDKVGHGTHVAGIVGARQNGKGVVGVAPEVDLVIAKGLGDDGTGGSAGIVNAIDWLLSERVHVINMSLGSPRPDFQILAAIRRAVDAGAFVIVAAGNSGPGAGVDYPGRFAETIAVAAVDQEGRIARFSSQGPEVDIAAPGQDVLSCYKRGEYAKLSGTSMATPFVTGAVVLMLAAHQQPGKQTPIKTVQDLREHIKRTATDAGPQGHDAAFGWGLINPGAMLPPEEPEPVIVPPPVTGEEYLYDIVRNGVHGTLVFKPIE